MAEPKSKTREEQPSLKKKTSMPTTVEGRRAAFKISPGPVLVVGLEAANESASVGGRTAIASFIGRATSVD